MTVRMPRAALALSLALAVAAAPAAAQSSAAALVGPLDPSPIAQPAVRHLPDFTAPPIDQRLGDQRRNGLIAAYRVGDNVRIGIGRFAVPEIARPRTHMESERNPTAIRPRERGIAAVGISLSF